VFLNHEDRKDLKGMRSLFRNRCDMALQPEVHGFVVLSNPDTDPDTDAGPEDDPLFLPMAEQHKRPAGTAEPYRVARPECVVSGFNEDFPGLKSDV
jgi:hypothetical protein